MKRVAIGFTGHNWFYGSQLALWVTIGFTGRNWLYGARLALRVMVLAPSWASWWNAGNQVRSQYAAAMAQDGPKEANLSEFSWGIFCLVDWLCLGWSVCVCVCVLRLIISITCITNLSIL